MLDLAPYLQRAVLEIALLAVPAGLLGSWIVLRRLAFFTHAVGTVSFPALVLAGAWGIAPQLAALAAALGFGAAQERVARGGRLAADAATGLILVGALALGVVLASDVFESGRAGRHAAVRLADRAHATATSGSPRPWRWSRSCSTRASAGTGWPAASSPAARVRSACGPCSPTGSC